MTPYPLDKMGDDAMLRIMGNYSELENVLNGRLDDENFKNGSLSGSVLKPASIGETQLGAKIIRVATGTYTGDGTANRVVPLSFQPQYVELLATTDYNVFTAMATGATNVAKWYRSSSGAFQGSDTAWQGIVEKGIKTGSSAGSLSNVNGQVYAYFVIGY
jgi:hypothetical protein